MTQDDRERMHELCALIEKEQDHSRFIRLIEELNALFQRQEKRLESRSKQL